MPNPTTHVKYEIVRQGDGSYAILQKSLTSKKVDIHSTHDTYEDANDVLTDLHHKPSQAETMEFMNDLKNRLQNI